MVASTVKQLRGDVNLKGADAMDLSTGEDDVAARKLYERLANHQICTS
jgi:hypothetical protein